MYEGSLPTLGVITIVFYFSQQMIFICAQLYAMQVRMREGRNNAKL